MPREDELSLAYGEVAGVNYFRGDVHAVLELKGNQVRQAVLRFIESGLFARGRADVGEAIIVIDRRYQKRFPRGFGIEYVVEDEFRRVVRAEAIRVLGRSCLGGMYLVGRLGPKLRKFLLVNFDFACAHVSREPGLRGKARAFLGLDENLEIGLGAVFVADFG